MEEKDLGITEVRGAKANISDLVVYGDGDTFALLCKASSKEQGWMKSTKVANVPGGCVIQVTTQQKNPDGSYAVAEALTYVPHAKIDTEQEPRRIVPEYDLSAQCSNASYGDDSVYKIQSYLGMLYEATKVGHKASKEIEEALAALKEKVGL